MTRYFALIFLLISFSISAQPSRELLFSINPSILKVHVATKEGNHGVGSGVVVAKDYVVTNCHVIANAQGVHVTKYGYSYSPTALIANWKKDLCILKVKFLELRPVKLGSTASLEYETEVFGKSYGGNTIKPHTSYGKVKGLHLFDDYHVVQSSAWFSLGASGGGLFNNEGELIGVTTFKTAGRFAFYYSMPVEIIKDMLAHGEEISVTTQSDLPFWDAPEQQLPYFMRVAGPLKNEEWLKLNTISQEWVEAEPASSEAKVHLAISLYHKSDFNQAKKLFIDVTKSNSRHTQCYYYLYKIAEKENLVSEQEKYKKIVMQLDENLLEE